MRATKVSLVAACIAQALLGQRDAGIAAFNSGHYSEARKLLSAADKNDETAQLFLALSQAATGDCAAALPTLTRAPLNAMGGVAAVKCYSSAGDAGHEFSLSATTSATISK